MTEWLTAAEAAKYLKIGRNTLCRLKDLPRSMVGRQLRYDRERLDQYLRDNEVQPVFPNKPLAKIKGRSRSPTGPSNFAEKFGLRR